MNRTAEVSKFRMAALLAGVVLMGCGVGAIPGDGAVDERATTSDELRKNDPCYVVRCAAGTHCESRGKQAACVANFAGCKADSDCRSFSNYCDGCSCQALSSGEADPVCGGTTVNCFADPCMNKSAVCKAGSCVLQ